MTYPKHWSVSTMGQIGRYLNGRAFKEADWKTSGRPIIRIQNLTGSGKEFNYFQGEVEPRYLVKDGDLLFSWAATLGTYIWHGPEAILNQHIFKVESNINPRFHRYLLEHSIQEMQSKTHGSGMVHITKGEFDKIEVPVPPMGEQERIVEALDATLSKLDSISKILNETQVKGNTLQRSILKHFLGDSTGSNPTTLGTHLETRKIKGIPSTEPNAFYLGLEHAEAHSGKITDFESASKYRSSSPIVEPGDVLYGRLRPYLNKVVIAPERLYVSGEFIVFKPSETILNAYLQLLLMSPSFLAFTASLDTGDRPRVSWDKIAKFEFLLPPLDRQKEVVAAIEAALDSYSRYKDEVGELKAIGDKLRRSILQNAFTGQLTKEM